MYKVISKNNYKDDSDNELKNDHINIEVFGSPIYVNKFNENNFIDAIKNDRYAYIGLLKMVHFNDNLKEYHNIYSCTKSKKGSIIILTKHGIVGSQPA